MRLIFPVLACALSLSACATVSRSTVDHFRIDTVPQGASVTTSVETDKSRYARSRNIMLTPEYVGCDATPCALPVPRRSKFIATLTHPGYEPAEVAIGYSGDKDALTVNMAQNLSVGTAGGAAAGAAAGTMTVLLAQTSAGIISVFSTAFGGGTVTAQTGGVVAGATASGAAVGLVVGVGSAAVDAASGANLNLYPNPVILQMAPKDAPVITDPKVAPLKDELARRKYLSKIACRGSLTPGVKTKASRNCKRAMEMDAARIAALPEDPIPYPDPPASEDAP